MSEVLRGAEPLVYLCVVLAALWVATCTVGLALFVWLLHRQERERERLLDRWQSQGLGEYKALVNADCGLRNAESRNGNHREEPLEEAELEWLDDGRPNAYPEAQAAAAEMLGQ